MFLVVLLVLSAVFVVRKKQSIQTKETFVQTANKLQNLKRELLVLLSNELDYDVSGVYQNFIGNMDAIIIVDCVQKKLNTNRIPLGSFNMDGEKMNDPILLMHEKNPDTYKVLQECGFLDLVGRIVSTAAWVTHAKDRSRNSFNEFIDCLSAVNFSNIDVWRTISQPSGFVMNCIV